jgi:hypothetical protein
VKTVHEHLKKVLSAHQGDMNKRLPIFLLAARASTHQTTGPTPTSMAFGKELRLPCDLMFGAPPTWSSLVLDLVDRLRDIQHYAGQHLKVASDRMKDRYDSLSISTGFQEGDNFWLYRSTRTRGNSPNLQPSWEGPRRCARLR